MAGISKAFAQSNILNNSVKAVRQSVKSNSAVNPGLFARVDAKVLGGRGSEAISKARASEGGLMKALIPGKGEISKNVKHSIDADDIGGLRSDIANSIDQNRTKMDGIRKQMSGLAEGSEEAKALQKQLDHYKVANKSLAASGDEIRGGSLTSEASMWDKSKQYFGNEEYGGTRKVAAGVGVGAAMLGTRFATGGSLTRNGNGESDIVGIPFV